MKNTKDHRVEKIKSKKKKREAKTRKIFKPFGDFFKLKKGDNNTNYSQSTGNNPPRT